MWLVYVNLPAGQQSPIFLRGLWLTMRGYEFTLSEFHPVVQVELLRNEEIQFWFEGENLDIPPSQRLPEEEFWESYIEITRPTLDDSAVNIYKNQGSEACIRSINTRIANYLLDEFEKVRESCPLDLENQYLKKIDEYYRWFWDRRGKSDEKIFERFLGHLHSIRTKHESPQAWYTLKEASKYLRTGVTKLRELIDAGTLKSYRMDSGKTKSTILLHRLDLDALILFDHSSGLTQRELARLKKYQK